LDVRATAINEEMKFAAVQALANLAKENVPEVVLSAYGGQDFSFGSEYIIPKPFDPRVLWTVAPAVAKAAIDTGVARIKIDDWNAYKEELKERLGFSKEIIRLMVHKAQKNPKKVVYPEGEEEKMIRAANSVFKEHIGKPILIGREDFIKNKIKELEYNVEDFEIHDPRTCDKCDHYAMEFYNKRHRKGTTLAGAKKLLKQPNYYAAMMVQTGDAEAMVGGLTSHYPETIRPALQCVGVKDGLGVVAGLYIVIVKSKVYFFADTTVNIDPTSEQLAEIAIMSADTVKEFEIDPKVAMLSFSNFGSAPYPQSQKVRKAVEIIKSRRPDLMVDGEMQADTAVVPSIIDEEFPFANLKGGANLLIFPDLNSGNIAYKLMARLTDSTVIGPILMGIRKPIHVLQRGATVDDIINMTAIAVVGAKTVSKK
jgi:malate dehydrogenase (oxaloacetate-decarboxylating)(NADP+)